ncbi:MAG: Gfo/Idh/MocA family oxidoreductase [Victivallales bacterium]|nr:Gfo/Idh/MocA family oxidoreductase [Victivallales bacterium]
MKPVSIVIVGLNFGRHIVDELTRDGGNPHMKLTGLCDIDRSKAEALASGQSGLEVYAGLDAVLSDPSVDAVGLFTGPEKRAELLSRIISAGKDVMTTKPFETDPAAAKAVLEESLKLGRVIHLNSPNPGISPDLAVIRNWREQYSLGEPVAARAEVWTHYREKADGGWYDDPVKCPLAPVFRLGIYLINDLVCLFGAAGKVAAMGTRLFTERPTADNGQLVIEFGNGALANIFASFCVRDGDHYRNGLTVNYECGTVYRNVGPERAGDGSELSVVVNDAEWKPRRLAAQTIVRGRSGHYDWNGFAAAIRRESNAPTYDIEHIIEPLRILNAMGKSEKSGKTEPVIR